MTKTQTLIIAEAGINHNGKIKNAYRLIDIAKNSGVDYVKFQIFDTKNFINKKFLNKMKKKALLVNIGRGSSLDEKDLLNHLNKNKEFFASLDVFKIEPLPKNNKIWSHKNVTVTPHAAALTDINSTIELMLKRYSYYKKNNKIKSDVNLKKGY